MSYKVKKAHGKCFPRRHMPAAIDSFYWFALNRYKKIKKDKKDGAFQRNDRRHAEDYGVSKDTVGRWVAYLENAGWLVPRGKRLVRDKNTGMYKSIPYDVLEHDAWAEKHPGKCRFLTGPNDESDPVPKMGTGETPTSPQNEDPPVPILANHLSLLSRTTGPQNKDIGSKYRSSYGSKTNRRRSWLVGRIESHLQNLGIKTIARERVMLGQLEQQYGTLMVLLGFLYFLTERARGIEGLDYPVSVFINDSKLWIEAAHKSALEEGCGEEESLIRDICEKHGYPIDTQSLCLLDSLRHQESAARCILTHEWDPSLGLAAVEDFVRFNPVPAKTPVTERAASPVEEEAKSRAASVVD